nr:hypothetical protein GCM10017611_12440 [Rhodococcus wratislaviensis]
MSVSTWTAAAYLIAALLFVVSLAGLSKHETSRSGVVFGLVGMTIALVVTVFHRTRLGVRSQYRTAADRVGGR